MRDANKTENAAINANICTLLWTTNLRSLDKLYFKC
jgi:hypothetical protein